MLRGSEDASGAISLQLLYVGSNQGGWPTVVNGCNGSPLSVIISASVVPTTDGVVVFAPPSHPSAASPSEIRSVHPPAAMKRARDAPDFSTLGVFTYNGVLCTQFIPVEKASANITQILSAMFGVHLQRSTFSITSSALGDFIMCDAALHAKLFGREVAEKQDLFSCLYIHEGSAERTGAEISGALSTLCERLAQARVPVLNVCTLTRNFMLMRQELEAHALATLRTTLELPEGEGGSTATGLPAQPELTAATAAAHPKAKIRVALESGEYCIGTLTVRQLKAAVHVLLNLFFLRGADSDAGGRPAFAHFFEMGGECSIILAEGALAAVRAAEPESAEALLGPLAPSLSRGWRVLTVAAPKGSDGVGILAAVCLPLAQLPLLNVSTQEQTFILVRSIDLAEALKLLDQAGVAVSEEE